MLRDDCNVEVYVYVTSIYILFHPKIYFGKLKAQAWAMVGSSKLTKRGLSMNIEHNLFIRGQWHTEPFISIEAQIAAFSYQAYLFDTDIETKLVKIEREPGSKKSDEEYKRRLYDYGIRPKAQFDITIPDDAQQVALEALNSFVENTKLEYAYQMLLLLVMLKLADENGEIPLKETARCFSEFYRLRKEAGLPAEKSRGLKQAVVDNPNVTISQLCHMLKTRPFPRFERQGLLELSEDERSFVVNPALLEALTPEVRESLRRKAVGRLVEHFEEEEEGIEGMVMRIIG
jgi:hypothetical protein